MTTQNMPFVLVGSGGHAVSVADLLEATGVNDIYTFSLPNQENLTKYKAISGETIEANLKSLNLVLAIGNLELRKSFMQQNLKIFQEGRFPTLIHPKSYVSPDLKIGRGSTIFANAYVGPSCLIGDFVVVNTNSVIEHNSIIGDTVMLGPSVTLCGNVNIGDDSFVGVGACISPKIKIGKNVTVGACSFVNADVSSNRKVYGLPAREIK